MGAVAQREDEERRRVRVREDEMKREKEQWREVERMRVKRGAVDEYVYLSISYGNSMISVPAPTIEY